MCTECGAAYVDVVPKGQRKGTIDKKQPRRKKPSTPELIAEWKEKNDQHRAVLDEMMRHAINRNKQFWAKTKDGDYKRKRARKILDDVSVGYPIDVACSTNGVIYQTFSGWVRKNPDLRKALDAALLAAERVLVSPIVEGAIMGSKEDAQWLLTHRLAHKYSPKVALDLPNGDDATVNDPTIELIAFITGESKKDGGKNGKRKR